MKLFASLVSLALFAQPALAQTAQAQEACAGVQTVITAAAARFKPLQGEEFRPDMFFSTAPLAGLKTCIIGESQGIPTHSCFEETPSEQTARARYAQLMAHVQPCLAGWQIEETDDSRPTESRTLSGRRFIGDTPGGKISIIVVLSQLPGDPASYRSSVGALLLSGPANP